MKYLSFIFVVFFVFLADLHGRDYQLTDEPIDIVIPCCCKDIEVLELCIKGAKENVGNHRRIIVVSPEKYTDSAEWFDEKDYPFSMKDVALELVGNEQKAEEYLKYGQRCGWYFQQLLKLYSAFVIPGISSNILILDADTIFLKPVSFLNSQNGGLYPTDSRIHKPYFKHMEKLIPDFKQVYPDVSGIVHHMLFQRPVVEDLLQTIENVHGTEAWRVLCRLVESRDLYGSGFSEYEIYFNFAFSHTDQVSIRNLKFMNISKLNNIPLYKRRGYDFVSCHHYSRH